MGNHASIFSSKSFHKEKWSKSCAAVDEKRSNKGHVVETEPSMTMSCVFVEELGSDEQRRQSSHSYMRRLLQAKKMFRRSLSSSVKNAEALLDTDANLATDSLGRPEATNASSAEQTEAAGPDFDAIFEHAAQRNETTLKMTPETMETKVSRPSTSSAMESRSTDTTRSGVCINYDDGSSAGQSSLEGDSTTSGSRGKGESNAWRRAMSLRVTFLREPSTEEDEGSLAKCIADEYPARRTSTASTSSRMEKLSRTTSSRCLGQRDLSLPVRRWLSSADLVCDQELIDLMNEIMPQDGWLECRRNSLAKRSSRRVDYSPLLNPAQIKLVRNHWNGLYITMGPTAIGNHLFNRMAFKNSQSRKVLLSLLVDHLSPGYFSKRHARLIGIIINFVVKNLELPENISILLRMVGHSHAQLWSVGLSSSIWNVFAEAFLECSLEWGEKIRRVDENRKAWAIIIAFVTEKLKAGFVEARKGHHLTT